MNQLKRSSLLFLCLIMLGAGIFAIQKVQANKTLAEQLADLRAEAEKIQKQIFGLQSQSFYRDLNLGDSGADVRQLQIVLNSDPVTQLTSFGSGAPGRETDFFGPLTRSAVIKFQNKYDLARRDGSVDSLTREKLNSILKPKESLPEQNALPQTQNIMNLGLGDNLFSESDEIIITFISNYSGLPGSSLTISGGGFEPEKNVVHFDNFETNNRNGDHDFSVSDLKSNGASITFTIPDNIPPARYNLFVSNSKNGISEDDTFFVVTSVNTLPPEILSITPSEGRYGEEVTIHGKNFTATGNELRTSYAVITGLESADGKTMKLKVEPYPDTPGIENVSDEDFGVSWPINFYIVNTNGVGKESAVFTLNL